MCRPGLFPEYGPYGTDAPDALKVLRKKPFQDLFPLWCYGESRCRVFLLAVTHLVAA
jgi:hypothetical protein